MLAFLGAEAILVDLIQRQVLPSLECSISKRLVAADTVGEPASPSRQPPLKEPVRNRSATACGLA